MTDYPTKPLSNLVDELKERAKEINCLYEVQETLTQPGINQDESFRRIIKVIPPGWQYPEICVSQIKIGEKTYRSENFKVSPWALHSDIIVQDHIVGQISVYYLEEKPELDEGPFLFEERRLINTIADQLGNYLLQNRLQDVFEKQSKEGAEADAGGDPR